MMFPTYAHSRGGQVTAAKQKKIALEKYLANPNYCLSCNKIIEPKPSQKIAEVRAKKFCTHSCSAKYSNSTRTRILKPKVVKIKDPKVEYDPTKEELFSTKSTWQSARSFIQKQARKIYLESNRAKECYVCGYINHIEVAHIKSVASFDKEVIVSEINKLSNLLALCPNHHWEFDSGLIILNSGSQS